MGKLSHVDESGEARMVDVGSKRTTRRQAVARGRVRFSAEAFGKLQENRLGKGDAIAVARLAEDRAVACVEPRAPVALRREAPGVVEGLQRGRVAPGLVVADGEGAVRGRVLRLHLDGAIAACRL